MLCENINCKKEHDGTYASGRFCSLFCSNSRSVKGQYRQKPCIKCKLPVKVIKTFPNRFVLCSKCKPQKKQKKFYSKTLCPICGNYTPRKQLTCGGICLKEHIRKRRKDKVLKLESTLKLNPRLLKTYIIETKGRKCIICGLSKWQNKPIPLVLDHINGRARDNRIKNVRLVCGNCDMQLSTYKSKNKNSDRKLKRVK